MLIITILSRDTDGRETLTTSVGTRSQTAVNIHKLLNPKSTILTLRLAWPNVLEA